MYLVLMPQRKLIYLYFQEGENDILAKMKEETKPILKNLEKFLGTNSYFVADKVSYTKSTTPCHVNI